MPVPTVVTTNGGITANLATHSLTTPTWTWQDGDVILLHFFLNVPATITGPTGGGWNRIAAASTSIASQYQSDWWWKRSLSAADSGLVESWASSTATPGTYQMIVIRGAEWNSANGGPVDVAAFQNATAIGLTATIPAVNTTGIDRLLIEAIAARDIWTPGAPSGGGATAELYTRSSGTAGAGAARTIAGDTEVRAAQGATGTRTVVATGTSDWWTGHMLAIKQALVSADQTPPGAPTGLTASIVT